MRSSSRSNSLRGAFLALTVGLTTPASAPPANLAPIDQCQSDGLPQFRAALSKIVSSRDGRGLMEMIAAEVQIGFDGDNGKGAFARVWRPTDRNSDLWPLMERMLRLGCAGNGPSRLIPSLGEQLNEEDDPFEVLLVSVPAAKLRTTMAEDAPTIATLGWDVVRQVERDELQAKVRLPDGREGWLFDDQVYGPLDYRMVIEKLGGRWMIVALVAGD